MIISFACPECKVQIEVADEYAGQSGQCPRCQQVIVVPARNQPKPTLTAPAPASEPWEKPRAEKKSRPRPPEAARRPRLAEAKPIGGPIWAWLVGGFGALAALGLLIASFAVLVFWRHAEATRPGGGDPKVIGKIDPLPKIEMGNRVTVGRVQPNGRRWTAFLQNGAFRIESELHPGDPFDLDFNKSRAKIYDIQMQPNFEYEIEVESNQIDFQVRLEDIQGPLPGMVQQGERDFGPVRMLFRPPINNTYSVHITSPNQGLGAFTLVIREKNLGKQGRP